MFNEIRNELGGMNVDRTKNFGDTSTLRTLFYLTPDDERRMINAAGSVPDNLVNIVTEFSFVYQLENR